MPTRVIFANGALSRLAELAAPIGSRPFVVTGQSSSRASGAIDRIVGAFEHASLHEGVLENPTNVAVEEAAANCRAHGCDFVIAVGGGSAIDLAKAVAVLAMNPGKPTDYYGSDVYTRDPLALIAIPTTAGTGTEVTPYSVLVDMDANDKRTIGGTGLFPRVAILDPELSVSMPRSVTLHTGFDVLSQGIEGILSTSATPATDGLGYETIRLVREWLPRAADHPGDLEARGWMLHAAMLSGIVVARAGECVVVAAAAGVRRGVCGGAGRKDRGLVVRFGCCGGRSGFSSRPGGVSCCGRSRGFRGTAGGIRAADSHESDAIQEAVGPTG